MDNTGPPGYTQTVQLTMGGDGQTDNRTVGALRQQTVLGVLTLSVHRPQTDKCV